MPGVRVVRTALRAAPTEDAAVALLHRRAERLRLPPPAALCGEWFGSRAVIAPTVRVEPVSGERAFGTVADLPGVADAEPGTVGGGWFGYLSYDLTDPSGRQCALPRAAWGWADHVLRLDNDGRWWFEALLADGEPFPHGLAADLDETLGAALPTDLGWRPTTLPLPSRDEHRSAVVACVQAIGAGEVFQANICTRLTGEFAGSPAALFAEGVRRLGPARAAYLAGDWGAVVSMSPELFLARHGRQVRSSPIKGTRPRRGAHDDHLAAELRRSVKDVAENVMITDLVRNDLGRVCEVGSVHVPELLAVRPAPGVWHLDSTVEGVLTDGTDDATLLHATFPPGSVTGAPKLRALDLVAELESRARGVYTGAIGAVSPVAGLELNVAIRTFEIAGGTVRLGVGGGITADSDPDTEWEECLHKAAPLLRLLETPHDRQAVLHRSSPNEHRTAAQPHCADTAGRSGIR
ncbi:aminodeoxychorismate synthase component I [Saccharomonospora xinjiangensis]|uniref:aminodeoxychorismate synthase component I n=1 Tax=Saccharomonospora xinjiangensis TaxID=75294 RepID=UPI00350F89A9